MQLDENLILDLVKRKIVTETFRRLGTEKKERIYQSSVNLFGEYGYDGLSVDRFCREAGLSKGSFFQYFAAKHDLLEMTILQFDAALRSWLLEQRTKEKAGSVKDRLRFAVHAFAEFAQQQPNDWRFLKFTTTALKHSGIALEGVALEVPLLVYLGEILGEGQQRREVLQDCNIPLVASAILGLSMNLISSGATSTALSARAREEQIVQFVLEGVSAK